MRIVYRRGDILEAKESVIIQGCNAQGVMGSGVAAHIRLHHPVVFEEYRRVYEEQGGFLALGQVVWVESGEYMFANGITQEFYGRDSSRRYVDYAAVRAVMNEVHRVVCDMHDMRFGVAMPLIGAGLANGNWSIISQIIEEEFTVMIPHVYIQHGAPVPAGVVFE